MKMILISAMALSLCGCIRVIVPPCAVPASPVLKFGVPDCAAQNGCFSDGTILANPVKPVASGKDGER